MNNLTAYVRKNPHFRYRSNKTIEELADYIVSDIHTTGGDVTYQFIVDYGDSLREKVIKEIENAP